MIESGQRIVDEPNAIERLQPVGECDSAMYMHFMNTLTDIVDVQRQRAYELSIDQRYDVDVHLRACVSLLSRFFYPSFRDGKGYAKWERYEEFFAIFPDVVPICYGAKAGGVIRLDALLKSCAQQIRDIEKMKLDHAEEDKEDDYYAD